MGGWQHYDCVSAGCGEEYITDSDYVKRKHAALSYARNGVY
jgi:hypothetical protein